MAGLTEEKRMEMEAEMNRFEQEILVPEEAPRMIIGANTFNKVQAALKAQNEEEVEDPPPGTMDTEPLAMPTAPPIADVPPLLPPPPPPPPMMRPPAPPPALRPPPPPPRPAFMPPQLRHRPPAPPPRFTPGPPMNMPHGPPRPPFQGNGPPFQTFGGPLGPRPMGLGPGPRMGMRPNFIPAVNPNYYNRFDGPNNGPPPAGVSTLNSAVISKPKVVYSSAPVLKKTKTHTSSTSSDTDKNATEKATTVTKPTPEHRPVISEPSVTPNVTQPGPAHQATPPAQPQVPMLPDYSLQDLMDLPMDAELVPGHHVLKKEKREKKKRIIRTAAGQCWEDQTLTEWESDDFRIFCGDLGNEVTDDLLTKAFSKYSSFLRAKVVRDKRSNKSKGYGFVSFKDPNDFVRAMREMNGKYVGNRPIKLRKSSWKDRNVEVVRRKDKEKKLLGFR